MPSNDPRLSKADRRDAAREKAAELRKQQEAKAKRTRILAMSGLGVAVIALGVVVAMILRQGAANDAAFADVAYGGGEDTVVAPALADVTAPAGGDSSGGIPVSSDGVGSVGDDDVVVQVYMDFMCPYCGIFDRTNGAELDAFVESGDVTVTYHVLSFLDYTSQGTNFSTRAANASAVVADQAPEQYTAFISALYANQPEENSEGLSDTEIEQLALDAGVPQAVVDTFTETVTGTYSTQADADADAVEHEGTWRTFAPWTAAVTQQALVDLGKISTPTILIDGEKFEGDFTTVGPLSEAITAAIG
ncbi:DsbA family protein [Cellulomonas soli]|uniref:DsbA family protein n=1 Tax=Cellulomonas soli TaxID=931535 RepID=UPI003F87F499